LANLFVDALFHAREIFQYSCGMKLGPAAILNQNLNLEMASKQKGRKKHPAFFYLTLTVFLSAAIFKSAIRHVRVVTAVLSDNTTAIVNDMITA